MKLEIDESDFQRLSPSVQRELIEAFTGKALSHSGRGRAPTAITWRQPVDITDRQAIKLVHGLSIDHRKRLALFARKNGRVRMKEILALTGERDLRATTAFQREITRRLRRLIDDPERKAQLIAWDIDATKWDKDRITIVDGIYYVSERTAAALRACLKDGKPGDGRD